MRLMRPYRPAHLLLATLLVLAGCSQQATQPTAPTNSDSPQVLQLNYEGFTVWLDCTRRGAIRFQYTLTRDQGNQKRHSRFYLDPDVLPDCQQRSTDSYQKHTETRFDRGHLVPANHVDNSTEAIRQSNFMTNILPQASNMNRGAWLRTEEIAECYRDIEPVTVIGGPIWGDHPRNDFVDSHGVATPRAFWKVLTREDRAIAWLIPNTAEATREQLDNYLVSIAALEARTGEKIPVEHWLKEETPEVSWIIPVGCDRG
jgi:endonuclease G